MFQAMNQTRDTKDTNRLRISPNHDWPPHKGWSSGFILLFVFRRRKTGLKPELHAIFRLQYSQFRQGRDSSKRRLLMTHRAARGRRRIVFLLCYIVAALSALVRIDIASTTAAPEYDVV